MKSLIYKNIEFNITKLYLIKILFLKSCNYNSFSRIAKQDKPVKIFDHIYTVHNKLRARLDNDRVKKLVALYQNLRIKKEIFGLKMMKIK